MSAEENTEKSEISVKSDANSTGKSNSGSGEKSETSKSTQSGERKPRRNYPPRKRYYNKNKTNKPPEKSSAVASKSKFQKVTVLVPLFNEDESLSKLTKQIDETFDKISTNYEILFVDDGSTDKSLQVIKDLARSNNKIKYALLVFVFDFELFFLNKKN